MKEGLQKFLDWAGDDAELAEWGLDDVPVLKQNLFLVGLDENWPNRWYDLQRIFLQAYPRKEGEGLTLESVVDRWASPRKNRSTTHWTTRSIRPGSAASCRWPRASRPIRRRRSC